MRTARRLDWHTPGHESLMAEGYNRTPQAPRRNRGETPREIKTFKSSHIYWETGTKAHTQVQRRFMHRKDLKGR